MNEIQFRIQETQPSDMNWIAGFQIKMAKESENLDLDAGLVQKGVSEIFQKPEKGFYIAVKMEPDSPAGCLLIQREWSDWRNAEVWWIHSVYILPEYRQKGLFRKMFEYVEKLAEEQKIAGLRLYVDRSNKPAIKVYERLGMNGDHYLLFEKMF